MFFARKSSAAVPETGARYVRQSAGRSVELAEILDVSQDGMGIPHVTFRSSMIRTDRHESAGRRTLALSCFRERFRLLEARP